MSDSTTLVQYDLRASYRRRSTVSCLRHYELGTVSSSTSSTCLQFVSRGMSCTHTHIRGVRTKVIPHVRLRGRAFVAFDKIRRVGFCPGVGCGGRKTYQISPLLRVYLESPGRGTLPLATLCVSRVPRPSPTGLVVMQTARQPSTAHCTAAPVWHIAAAAQFSGWFAVFLIARSRQALCRAPNAMDRCAASRACDVARCPWQTRCC